jgi:glycosyltransferase involved in cell wall biosynthesis
MGSPSEPLLFSIIIPTYNEEEDIAACLDAACALDYERKEIIVVDSASTDNTPNILDEYRRRGAITLLSEPERRGVCSARNYGIDNARGDIVVLLNADVILPPTFLRQILRHYDDGADFVLCEAEVLNQERLIPRYTQAMHTLYYSNRTDLAWTEGFSARRRAIKDVGGFKPFPKRSAGEDAVLGLELEKKGYRKVIDHNIVIHHLVITDLRQFMRLQYERGRGAAFFELLYLQREPRREALIYLAFALLSFAALFFYPINLVFFSGLAVVVVGEALLRGISLARVLGRPADLTPFSLIYLASAACQKIGYVQAAIKRA